ncbi:MAG: hypothetical protein JSS89_05320 [Bacteroidetes bacterium]|nr:hypothetical protein [Bacteroidota bacterium]
MPRDPIKPFLLILLLLVLGVHQMSCQLDVGTRVIRGEPVTLIYVEGCVSVVDVVDVRTFNVGDRILIHQAKGMEMSTAVGDSGTPTSQGSCGNFELATIDRIQGSSLYLTSRLTRTYDVAGLVQAVPVLSARKVNVNGDVTASPWDGRCGGIIAIEATDTISLSRPIRVSGVGFTGGETSLTFNACSPSDKLDARYPSDLYGAKGEGWAIVDVNRRSGRGRLANGGGGGANHNAGGGGGANGGQGGNGGAEYGVCGVHLVGGLGGSPCTIDPRLPRLFFGGGGGGSHQNEGNSSPGGRGGGIIVLIAPTIVSTKVETVLESSGVDARQSSHEGSSGGGAGGTIFLAAEGIGPKLRVVALGGQGGNVSAVYQQPHGPGGGGGGGLILLTAAQVTPSLTVFARGGANGINEDYPTGVQHDWYATPGGDGQIVTSCTFSAAPQNSRLQQITPIDLGTNDVGAADTVTIRYANVGTTVILLDRLVPSSTMLTILGATPSVPATLVSGDTLSVRAEIRRPVEGLFRDTINMFVSGIDGCADTISFPEYWTAVDVADTCQLSATITGGAIRTGGTLRIAVRCNPPITVQIPATYVCTVSYPMRDLYVEPATSPQRRWTEPSGDRTILHVEGAWRQSDTVFTIDAVGLLSSAFTTEIRLDGMTITSVMEICTTGTSTATIVYDSVCSSRPMRNVLFGGSQRTVTVSYGHINITSTTPANTPRVNSAATYTIWTTFGAEYRSGDLEPGTTSIPVPAGLYVVAINDATSAPNVHVVMVVE